MRFALLMTLGLVLGALGGAAFGIGVGLAWSEFLQSPGPQDSSGTLAFFTFMPIGGLIGAFCGAVLFGVIAMRDVEIQIEQPINGPERN
jgi:hypothetical protein